MGIFILDPNKARQNMVKSVCSGAKLVIFHPNLKTKYLD